MEIFRKGDRVRVQHTKYGRWSTKGTIVSQICHEGAQNPSSYLIKVDFGGTLLQNGKFVRLVTEQRGESTSGNANRATEAPEATTRKESRAKEAPSSVSPGDPEVQAK